MKQFIGLVLIPLIAACPFGGCVHSDIPEYVEFDSQRKDSGDLTVSLELQLAKLNEFAAADSDAGNSVKDVRSSLLARIAARDGKIEIARQHWLDAAEKAPAKLGREAFEEWVKTVVQDLGGRIDSLELSRLILTETSQGQRIPYMIDRKLNNPLTLMRRLKELVPQALLPEETAIAGNQAAMLAPLKPGIPAGDALLVSTSQLYCKQREPLDESWAKWERTLDRVTFLYWRAVVADCKGDNRVAIATYASLVPRILANVAHGSRAVYAAGRLAALHRAAGNRQQAADAYTSLMLAYNLPSTSASDFGDSAQEFQLRRINDTLWASRYRALVGDLENARQYSQRALELIDEKKFQLATLTGEKAVKVSEYRAEAVQILAFRVSLELGDLEQAEIAMRQALSFEDLTDEWRDRFNWNLGLYQYMRRNFSGAKSTWEQMLTENTDEDYRPKLLFWIARAYFALQQDDEARFYLKSLGDEYPLSYYSVVAPTAAGLEAGTGWQRMLGKIADLGTTFKERRDFETKVWRSDRDVRPLLDRAEILLAAGLSSQANAALRELEAIVRKKYGIPSSVKRFIYLSRMLSQSGDFHRSIWLTTEINKDFDRLWKEFPDQILVAFPAPFQDFYQTAAKESGIDSLRLMAVSRQESSFRANVVSSAGAVGMMQLLPSTAERIDVESRLNIEDMDLTNPAVNIRLGASYLKLLDERYKGFRPAVYAAYNAGEFAVDVWLEKRRQEDPTLWNELIPFGETNNYVKNVWRNEVIYRYLATQTE